MRRLDLFAYSLVLGLTACGGGGGGDGGTTSVSGGTNFPPQVPLAYSGASTAATVSATSAGTIAANVIGASADAGSSSLLTGVSVQVDSTTTVQPTGASGLTRRLARAMRPDQLASARSGMLAGVTIDQTTACDSGSMRISGTLADNGTGTLSVAYNACRTGTDTLNGPASVSVNSYDQTSRIITDGIVTYTRVNFTGPGINSDITGSLHTQVNKSNATETLTLNTVTQDNTTGRMTKTENLAIVNVYDSVTSPTFISQSITGRVFDSVAGYVDVTSTTAPYTAPWGPLYYATSTQAFPDWGLLDLTGAAGGHIRVTSLGVDLAKLEVDANNDGTFENSARMKWADFKTSIGADLADNDGDGMHNSWETAYGLNPNDPSDAAADPDADGASNRTEYLAGSDPRTNGSVPPAVRHLWVTGVRDLAFDSVSGMIDVFVGATGSGVQLDPVTRELGAAFSGLTEPNGSGNLTTAPDDQGRTFTLSPTAVPTTWTLTSSTGASLTIDNIAGTSPGSLIRYGARGLAFRTVGASGPGYVYLVESRQLIP